MNSQRRTHPIVKTSLVTLYDDGNPFRLEIGSKIAPVTIAYETYGELNKDGTNAILVCHALTGSAHAAGYSDDDPKSIGWWDSFIGDSKPLDTTKYFVVCSNILGGCYGTTGSNSKNPETGVPYGISFPQITVRDMVKVQKKLVEHLGIKRIRTVIGGSLGGMQVLEWGIMFPELIDSLIPIATASRHSAWCIGLNEVSRQAITNDPAWRNGNYYGHGQPEKGLSLARQIAMISYRSEIEYDKRFSRDRIVQNELQESDRFSPDNIFEVVSYLRHQGKKLVSRFDANTYLAITKAMDLHDISVGRAGVEEVLRSIKVPTLNIGIDSDILYPVREQKEITKNIPHSAYKELSSPYGHDAFLIEFEQMGRHVRSFLA